MHSHIQSTSMREPHPHSAFDQPRSDLLMSLSPQQQLIHGFHQNDECIPQLSQHQLDVRNQNIVGTSNATERPNGEARRVSCHDIQQVRFSNHACQVSRQEVQQVQYLIERCLQLYMNQKEVTTTLQQQAKIEPSFTGVVWQRLEEQNPDFFQAYYTRLIVKQQILQFNDLLRQQAALMDSMDRANAPCGISNGLHSASIKQPPSSYPINSSDISRSADVGCSLLSSNPSLINGSAGMHSMPVSEDKMLLRGDMEMTSSMQAQLSDYPRITPKPELDMESNTGYQNNVNFIFNTFERSMAMPSNHVDAHVSAFNANETHLQSEALRDPVGIIPRNFSLSDLTADFANTTDILESYTGSAFLSDDFLNSSDNDCLGDNRMLNTGPESYEGFTSD